MSLGANIEMAEKMYARWKGDRTAVAADWVNFFEGFELGMEGTPTSSAPAVGDAASLQLQARVIGAIYKYRVLGHTQADINPLFPAQKNPQLSLERLGLSAADMDKTFDVGNYKSGRQQMKIGELIKHLEETYCGKVSVEYAHIQDSEKRYWLQAKMEGSRNKPSFDAQKKRRILKKILETETFENFLHTRFVGQKRFSLEGGETTIAAMDALVERAAGQGVKAYVLGMAHRGRLSVMTEILGKPYKVLFEKFGGDYIPHTVYGSGDVKYHLGYSTEVDGIGLHLTPNPSHLEAVNPVVEGRARALQRRYNDLEARSTVVPVLIHGDAAFIGQGIVAETLNFSKLEGYRTGGTLHFVINNQIGFTAEPQETRSSRYCTDVAKIVEAPIFHVNGDDPEAVVYAMELSLEYRQKFHEDVVVDMLCYRKHGHNESDEPRFTQPHMYSLIDKHPLVSKIYAEKLTAEGLLNAEDIENWTKEKINKLEAELNASKEKKNTLLPFLTKNNPFEGSTHPQPQAKWSFAPVVTGVPLERLENLTRHLTEIPADFSANPKIIRLMQQRRDTFAADKIDWGLAEQLSWGSLLLEGTPVRLSGQDCVRGTFSHRHAGWYDTKTDRLYEPLNHLSDTQARFCVHNSSLSEAAVLGFDYGYSLDYPEMLCQWEAQFGDFANGAQSIIDQFIAASEMKWQTHSGLVMLLPHGYEGQGPEHSSARLERFLQLCAEENIQVVNPSTPAQIFHLLRRQMKRAFLKPLIVMTPKSLLRLEDCVSTREDFVHGEFQEIIDSSAEPKKVSRVIACSGKVFYDLESYRKAQKIDDVAIIRVEQLYPFHADAWHDILKRYKNAKSFVWCQEEPKNMGAWSNIRDYLSEGAGHAFDYAGRPASASPAAGALSMHKKEQAKLIEEAFRI